MKRVLTYLIISILSCPLYGQDKINDFEELAKGYYNQGKSAQAAEFYSKAGYAYWNKRDNSKAESAFQKAYDLFSNQGNANASIAVGNNLGILYLEDEKYTNAHNAFSNVLSFARKTKNSTEVFNALMNLGSVAIELASFDEAISRATEALSMAKEMNNLKSLAKCYSILAESYEKKNDESNAYKYFELYSSIDKKIKAQELEDFKELSTEEINKAQEKKRVAEIELKIKKGELKLTQDSLGVAERLAYERQMQVELRNAELKKKELQLLYERQVRRTLIIGISITVLFLLILGLLLRQKLLDNKTLRQQKEEITNQRNKLDIQNKKITDSIYYGLRIQQAMLPDLSSIKERFDSFVIYRPKDIVSGDFYWFYEIRAEDLTYQFIALADCTGHGVPGAFMSMIGNRLLSEIVAERKIYQPSQILEAINCDLRDVLDQENKKSMDGMDMAFCRISIKNGKYDELIFAGAKRPVLICKKNEDKLITIEGDRKGIGGFLSGDSKTFTDKTIPIQREDTIILYSDGIIDQQNSQRNRFGTNRFSKIISDHMDEPLDIVKTAIENTFDSYTTPEEQRDDITVLGLRLK
ncbi:MAG TPA: SpoIIE family protein phosphatase [Bacteroidales bacterium]